MSPIPKNLVSKLSENSSKREEFKNLLDYLIDNKYVLYLYSDIGDYYYEDDQDGFIVKAEVYKELKNRKKEEEWDYSILNQAENELEYKRMLKEATMNMLASTLFERKVFNKLEPVEESETIKELYEEANKNNKEDK